MFQFNNLYFRNENRQQPTLRMVWKANIVNVFFSEYIYELRHHSAKQKEIFDQLMMLWRETTARKNFEHS